MAKKKTGRVKTRTEGGARSRKTTRHTEVLLNLSRLERIDFFETSPPRSFSPSSTRATVRTSSTSSST
jgi:hypothetical protein